MGKKMTVKHLTCITTAQVTCGPMAVHVTSQSRLRERPGAANVTDGRAVRFSRGRSSAARMTHSRHVGGAGPLTAPLT